MGNPIPYHLYKKIPRHDLDTPDPDRTCIEQAELSYELDLLIMARIPHRFVIVVIELLFKGPRTGGGGPRRHKGLAPAQGRRKDDLLSFGETFDLGDLTVSQHIGLAKVIVEQAFEIENQPVTQGRHRHLRKTPASDLDRIGMIQLFHTLDRQEVVYPRGEPDIRNDCHSGRT